MRVFASLIAELKFMHLHFLGCRNVKKTMNTNILYRIRVHGPTHFYDSSITPFKRSEEWEDNIALNDAQMAYFT